MTATERPTTALFFTPGAIRDAFDTAPDDDPRKAWVADASNEQLLAVAAACLSSDVLWATFHAVVEAAVDELSADPHVAHPEPEKPIRWEDVLPDDVVSLLVFSSQHGYERERRIVKDVDWPRIQLSEGGRRYEIDGSKPDGVFDRQLRLVFRRETPARDALIAKDWGEGKAWEELDEAPPLVLHPPDRGETTHHDEPAPAPERTDGWAEAAAFALVDEQGEVIGKVTDCRPTPDGTGRPESPGSPA